MLPATSRGRVRPLRFIPVMAIVLGACASPATPAYGTPGYATPIVIASTTAAASTTPASPMGSLIPSAPSESSAPPEASPSSSQEPDTGGGTGHGDIPDNAVFLTFKGTNPAFSIQYVEGWQVSRQTDGVIVRDKDSSETVSIVGAQADVAGFVATTDLPALEALAGFKLVKQDTIKVGTARIVHLVYHLPAPADPVTGKRVPSTVDRYYVPGPSGLAIVSLSTPDGVDNVDAFRQMIESFTWS